MAAALRIILAQINPVVGGFEYNLNKIREAWKNAPAETDLIVFPELSVCGYPAEDLILKPAFLEQAAESINALADESLNHKPWIIIGGPYFKWKKTFNAAYMIGGGRIRATVRKHFLPNYGVFDEKRVFSTAQMATPVTVKGHRIGLMVCEDTWRPEPAAFLKKKGAKLLVSINASPYDIEKQEQRIETVRARVSETGLPLFYVNQCGGQDDLVFDGASFAMNEKGDVVFQGDEFVEGYYSVQHPLSLPKKPIKTAKNKETESIYKALATGLRDYVLKNGFKSVLLGLSGGIDSALTAAIAVDALGNENVHGLFMPSKYTSKASEEDARAVAKNLSIRLDTISIANEVAAFEKELSPHFTPRTPDITFQNIQSRCRGVTLMALSNATGKMVLSTGNKSEIATGYATLYGDMCGGYNPLKDVYKTQVYELARWRNRKAAVIPDRVLTKAPTAELKPDQTDQDTLPPYDVLDAILKCLIERDMGVDDTAAEGHDKATVSRVQRMLDMSEHKRRQAAPGPKISTRAFARERRYPMTNGFTKIIEK